MSNVRSHVGDSGVGSHSSSYSHLEIQSEDQLGCVEFHGWPSEQRTLLLSERRVTSQFRSPLLRFCNPGSTGEYDWFPSSFVYFVSPELSERLQGRIRAEFLPIRSLNLSRRLRQYKIMHILDRFAALDRGLSAFTEMTEELGVGIASVSELVLDQSKIGESMAFVLSETAGTFFSNKIVDEVRVAGFRGLRFTPAHRYRFGC
jgi:hypothetical protein